MSFSNNFIPNSCIIGNITKANPGVVTTTSPNGYSSGLFVRLVFPLNVGMNELNNQVVQITVIDNLNFSIGVNTSNFNSFAPSGSKQLPQVIPVGTDALGILEATTNNNNIIPET